MSERASERDAVVRYLRATAYDYDADALDPTLMSAAERIADEAHSEFRSENRGNFDLIDGLVLARIADERDEAILQRDELRRLIAPGLGNPFEEVNGYWVRCRWCRVDSEVGSEEAAPHAPDCPALPANRDRLLGRPPTDEGESA